MCLQIHWLAHGLQSFDAVFIVPVFQCFFISVSIFGGGVYFKEFAKMPVLAVSFVALQDCTRRQVRLTRPSSLSHLQLGMFFFGASVTLSGVYLLSKREMNTLRPSGKFRAVVKMIIFIKRAQKAKNIEHRWVQGKGPLDEPSPTAKAIKAATAPGPSLPKSTSFKVSKASVMPVDSRYPKLSDCGAIELQCSAREGINGDDANDNEINADTFLDASGAQIKLTQKRFDK